MGWWDAATQLLSGDIAGAAASAGMQLGQQGSAPDVVDDSGGSGDDYGVLAPPLPTSTRLRFPASQAQLTLGGQSGGAGADRSGGTAMTVSDLVYKAAVYTGRALSAKAIVRFILRWGWQTAQLAFGLQAQELMPIFVAVKAKPTRRRGPHLYTVLKRIRTGRRYEKMLAKVAAKVPRHGGGRHRRHSNVVPFRRRKAR